MITTKKIWSYEDYLKLVDDKQYEMIEGELFEMPSPNFKHQKISTKLSSRLLNYVEKGKLGEVVSAPMDVILSKVDIVQPDIIFISNENQNIITNKIFGSPDLVIEILSEWSVSRDKKDKYQLYEKYKVKEYWIVDPDNKSFEVYVLDDTQYKLFHKGTHLKSKLFTNFHLEFNSLEE